MAKDFGLTWWGRRWLDSLTQIDFANRIPRGARYARNGSVREIVFTRDGIIKARVKGTRPSPYKIEIQVPQFPKEKKCKLIKALAEHPALLSRLLNKELPEEVLPIAVKCGLKVFPASWKDLGMHCSCPDWAVPCKHIAAVIYKVSQEIDNDPFLVFKIHGLDIPAEVETLGIKLGHDETMAIEKTVSLLKVDEGPASQRPWVPDLSTIPNLTDRLTDILEEDPPFETGFREKYRSHIRRAQRSLSKMESRGLIVNPIRPSSEVRVLFDDDLGILGEISEAGRKIGKVQSGIFIESLREWEALDRSLMQPSAETVFNIYRLARILVLNGCIVPQILETPDGSFKIIWGPALMDPAVKLLTEEAIAAASNLASFRKKQPLKDAGLRILEAFITILLQESEHPSGGVFSDLFFCGSVVAFNGIGESGIPGSIKVWLSPFKIADSPYKPFLQIEDTGKGFSLDFGFVIKGRDVALRNILARKTYEADRFKMLSQLSLVFRHVKEASAWVDGGAMKPMGLSDKQCFDFLRDIVPVVRLLSVRVILPKGLETLLHPRPSLRIGKKASAGKTFIRAEDLLDFNWMVAIGGVFITEEEFHSLVKEAKGLVRFKSSFFCVDDEDLERISKAFSSSRGPRGMRILQAALTGEYDGAEVSLTDEVRDLIRSLTATPDEPVPEGITAALRPYQKRGYSWMYKNWRLGFGSIIADDMGLGKTLQVITFLQKLKDEGALERKKALIVVPTGLLANWETELDCFAPRLSHFRYHGPGRRLQGFDADVLLTSYGVARSDAETIGKLKWEVEVIDEAQNIKNLGTAQTKAVKSIPSESRIAMSGTPVENRLSEYWSIMDFVNKGYLGTAQKFKEQYVVPIEAQGDQAVAERFRKVTAPFMMRRLKTDKSVISDLPDKVIRNFNPTMTPSQAALYEQVVQEYMATLKGVSGDDNKTLFKRQGIVLQMILALKQICDHPSLFLKDGKSDMDRSGKCSMLADLVRSIVESGDKVLIFTQFKEMGDLLQVILEKELGRRPLFYHGGCSLKQRLEMVDRFQNIRSEQVFILSLKAAGTGLNLTAASHVIHFDRWWNPAVEAQATDRAYRIGQHKNVMVTFFVTAGTFEEKIDNMISEKKALADLTVASGENWIGKLSDEELKDLFSIS